MKAGEKQMSVLILVLLSVSIAVSGQLIMKKGMNTIGFITIGEVFSIKIFSIIFQKYVFIGFMLYLLASLIWLVVISQEELSFVYPLIAIGYILTTILSKLIFNESLSMFRFFGILLICSGVYLIVLKI